MFPVVPQDSAGVGVARALTKNCDIVGLVF